MTLKIGVLASTKGTSLQGTIDAIASGDLRAEIKVIISNNAHAPVLYRGEQHGIPNMHINSKGVPRQQYDVMVHEQLQQAAVDVVLLVGYMRIVSDWFVEQWRGKLLNVHPSLLPAFAGGINLDVHQAVIDAKATETGCTIHHVTEILDGGKIVYQESCPITPQDTANTLKTKVQALESRAFVHVLKNWSYNN